MFLMVCHFDFHFSKEKVPSSKKLTFWSTTRQCETKVRILERNFEQFSCIQKQKIYDEIFGWFVTATSYALGCHCSDKQCSTVRALI